MTTAAQITRTTASHRGPVDPTTSIALRLSWALAAATFAACVVTLTVTDLLSGTPVMNGSAKGTALVALVVAVPVLLISTSRARAGSIRALVVTTGITAYLLYNGVMFIFATPFNQAFLLYAAMLGLALWTLSALSLALWNRVGELVTDVPWWVPAYIWLVVVLNATAWLARVLPATIDDAPMQWLAGTGLTTNPVIAQDLAFWLPVMAWLGWGVWQARPPAVALAAAGLVFWVVESLGVAVDQWWGHRLTPLDLGVNRGRADVRGTGVGRPAAHAPAAPCSARPRSDRTTVMNEREENVMNADERWFQGLLLELDEAECWELVRPREVGRVAYNDDRGPWSCRSPSCSTGCPCCSGSHPTESSPSTCPTSGWRWRSTTSTTSPAPAGVWCCAAASKRWRATTFPLPKAGPCRGRRASARCTCG